MIIFYNKHTKDIVGVIDGRVHPKHVMDKVNIKVSGVAEEDIVKYVVPYKALTHKVWKPRYLDGRLIGHSLVTESKGMSPDVTYEDIIKDFEKGKKNIYNYKIDLDESGEIVGFTSK